MDVQEVGVREFKAHMGEYLRRVKEGEEFVITDRGKRVCRVMPDAEALNRRFLKLAEEGVLLWNGETPVFPEKRVPSKGKKTVSEMVIEDRG